MGRNPAGAARRRGQGDRSRTIRGRPAPSEHAGGQGAPEPPCACAHSMDRHLRCPCASGRQGDRHARRLRRPPLGVRSGGRDAGQLPGRRAQRDGAREGALRRTSGGRGGGNEREGRQGGAGPREGRLRGAPACPRRARGHGAGCAAAPRGHGHGRGGAGAVDPVQRGQGGRVHARRRRGGLRAGGRDRRTRIQHPARASGLHRAAFVRRERCRGRPGRALVHHPGPLRGARALRQAPGDGGVEASGHRVRDRRRLRRKDGRVPGAARARAVAQVRTPRQDDHVEGGGLPRLRPRARHLGPGPGGNDQGRPNHCGGGGAEVPGGGVSGIARAAGLHVRIRAL